MKRYVGKPSFVKSSGTFMGVPHVVWFRIAKWIGIAGVGLSALITAVATAWKLIHG